MKEGRYMTVFLHGFYSVVLEKFPEKAKGLFNKNQLFLSIHKSFATQKTVHPFVRVKTLSCASLRGSITVEAAFALPIALFALLVMLGFFVVLQVETEMTEALQYASRKIAVECAVAEYAAEITRNGETSTGEASEEKKKKVKSIAAYAKGAGCIAAAQKKTKSYLAKNGCWTDWIKAKKGKSWKSGISFLSSKANGDYIKLCVRYKVRLPIGYFGVSALPVKQIVCARKWTGDGVTEENEEEEGYVYVTKTGKAYHESLKCHYLKLSIKAVSKSSVSKLRNKSGGKYYPCSCAKKSGAAAGMVYITNYGTKYHSTNSCSRLTRNIKKIKKSEADGYHPCSKCAA